MQHTDNLIRMVNQIGSFFEAMPDRPEARMELVQHIKKFWEPRMRHALLEHVDANGEAELSPMVAEALASHRAVIE